MWNKKKTIGAYKGYFYSIALYEIDGELKNEGRGGQRDRKKAKWKMDGMVSGREIKKKKIKKGTILV